MLRLLFGVECAFGIFQRKLKNILKNFDYVLVFLDGAIINVKSESEHSERVECTLKWFSYHDVRLNN